MERIRLWSPATQLPPAVQVQEELEGFLEAASIVLGRLAAQSVVEIRGWRALALLLEMTRAQCRQPQSCELFTVSKNLKQPEELGVKLSMKAIGTSPTLPQEAFEP
mmetsp:Transcript_152631/g.284327  ORF Transcript_152631/g.284327 Transcript_152631/m.284327 type:complete len:106 (+) Transcript_152631:629-946(+)